MDFVSKPLYCYFGNGSRFDGEAVCFSLPHGMGAVSKPVNKGREANDSVLSLGSHGLQRCFSHWFVSNMSD